MVWILYETDLNGLQDKKRKREKERGKKLFNMANCGYTNIQQQWEFSYSFSDPQRKYYICNKDSRFLAI